MKRNLSLFALLLAAAFMFHYAGRSVTPLGEEISRTTGNPKQRIDETRIEMVTRPSPRPDSHDKDGGRFVERIIAENDVNPENAEADGFVRKVLSETWTDPEGKPGRQRVRIVEADFKYPNIRLVEELTTDPETGERSFTRVTASVADHLIVGLKPASDTKAAMKALEDRGYRIRSIEKDSYILVELADFADADAQMKRIADLQALEEFIEHAEPDWLVYPSVLPNDPAIAEGKMWGLANPGAVAGTVFDADIDAPEAWETRSDASSVVVAVTDTGIRYTHEDLAPNMWDNGSGIHGFDAYDDDSDPMDTDGHGTHCAGTIGARGNNGVGTSGVAWNVKLMALRFIGPNGGTTSDAIRVINYARLNGADVISASWGGGGFSQGLLNAIMACYAEDIPIAAAAGNSSVNNDMQPHYPSGYEPPNIVSVGATDSADRLSHFSNHGRVQVDLTAPGGDILSCGIGSDSDYRYLSGTSMATPHVAAALALAKAQFPTETCEDLINRIYSSVDVLPGLDGKVATGGRLNLRRMFVQSRPAVYHDDFDKPYPFRGCFGYWCGNNGRMTREPGENTFSPDTGSKSMWFRWTAPENGLVRFKGAAGAGDVSVVAFEGTDKNFLRRVQDNFQQRPTASSYLYFYAERGKTYSFSVDSRLNVNQIVIAELVQRPENDMLLDARNLGTGREFTALGNNCGATSEPFEIQAPHAGKGVGHSVWWKWTPDFSGSFYLTTRTSAIDTVLAVYTGTSSSNLSEVASNDDRSPDDWTSDVIFNVTAGTTYLIAVDSYRSRSVGEIVLTGYGPKNSTILKPPFSKSARIGDSVTFDVVAVGQDIRFQWEVDGNPIPGAVQPHYTIRSVFPQDFGDYRVRVSNATDSVYSDTATLSELAVSPRIIWQTRSRSVSTGENVELRARVTGTAPLTYKWYKDGVLMPGETGDTMSLPAVSAGDGATYVLNISNPAGFTDSEPILLKVFSSPWDGWQYIDPVSQTGRVIGIFKQGGSWVAFTQTTTGMRVSTSREGKNWSHKLHENLTGQAAAYGNGFWLCAGPGNSGLGARFFKSTDLATWQQFGLTLDSPVASITGFVFHDGYFYLNSNNRLYRSANGQSWTKQQSAGGADLKVGTVVSAAPGLLAYGDNTVDAWFLNGSANPWQAVVVEPVTSGYVTEAYWHIGRYYAYLSSALYQSTDGINWTKGGTFPTALRSRAWLVENGGRSYVNGNNGFHVSDDGGVNWVRHQNMFPSNTTTVAADGNLIVVGTDKGGLIAAEDPFTTTFPQPMLTSLLGLVYEGGQFIARNSSLGNDMAISADGETWSTIRTKDIDRSDTAPLPFETPVYIAGEFWQPGYNISQASSVGYYRGPVPGAAWKASLPAAAADYLASITEGPAGILAIRIVSNTSYGAMMKSTDGGRTWSAVSVPGSAPSKHGRVRHIGSLYAYDEYFGSTYVSADLVTWKDVGQFFQLMWHEGKYWAWFDGGIQTSTDLVAWAPVLPFPAPPWGGEVISFNGALVRKANGELSYSYDGVNWVATRTGFTVGYMASSGDVLVVGGSSGQLARTGRAPSPSPTVAITEPADSAGYAEGSVIAVRVDAFSPNGGAQPTVRLYYDGILIGTKNQAPYDFDLPVGKRGRHLIHAEASQGSGSPALARKHLIVSPPHLANRFRGSDGAKSLPGEALYRNGIYLAFGSGGYLGSDDGTNWQPVAVPSSVTSSWGLIEGGGIVVGVNGAKVVVTRDGVNWFESVLPAATYGPIKYSHGLFWALSSGGGALNKFMVSADGINWTSRDMTLAPPNLSEVEGNPNGILLGRDNSSQLWRSLDGGRSWRVVSGFTFVSGIGYIGERFYLREGNGSARRAGTSTDGVNWTWSAPDSRYSDLKFVNGTAFAFDFQNTLSFLSYDGLTWSEVPGQLKPTNLTWGVDGYFYASIRNPSTGLQTLHRSRNGLEWTEHAPMPFTTDTRMYGTPEGLFLTTYTGGLWKLGWGGSEWETLYTPVPITRSFLGVEGGAGKILAIDQGIRILASPDGAGEWTTVYNSAGSGLSSLRLDTLLFKDGVWLAWDQNVVLLRSTDGTTFTNVNAQTGALDFIALAHDGTTWMAIRKDGSVVKSADGLSWAAHAAAGAYPDAFAYKMIFHNGAWFCLSKINGSFPGTLRVFTSTDCLTWTQTAMPLVSTSGPPALIGGELGVIAGGDMLYHSTDPATWTRTIAHTSVFAHGNAFYLVKNGWLEKSTDGVNWVQDRQVGSLVTNGTSISGTMYLYGSTQISKVLIHDMAVSNPGAAAKAYAVGDKIDLGFRLENTGTETFPAGNYGVEVFLSSNGFHGDGDDSYMGLATVSAPTLAPGEAADLQITAIIPNQTPPGDYRVGLFFDREGSSIESISSNNFGMSVTQPVGIAGWVLSAVPLGEGQVNQDSNLRVLSNGSRITLNASAGKGAVFTGWAGDALGTESQVTILMDGDKEVLANFSSQVNLQVFVQGLGTVEGLADLGNYPVDGTASITAAPMNGWVFAGWGNAASGNNPQANINMNTNKAVTARFAKPLATWKSELFSASQLADPLVSGDEADPDGDGLKNWQEYLHSSNPRDASSRGIARMEREGGFLTVIYTRNAGAEGALSVSSQGSRNLGDWDAPDFQERILEVVGGVETVEARLPATSAGTGFVRFVYRR